jgi:hypothetical protein
MYADKTGVCALFNTKTARVIHADDTVNARTHAKEKDLNAR